MKTIYNFLLILTIIFLNHSCIEHTDSLEKIKLYKPDDKYFKASMVSLHFIIETSAINKVDTVFRQLISSNDLPVSADGCQNGVYIGESPYDAYDYRHWVKIEIKDERIISIDYNEIHKSGNAKQEDEAYCKEMSVTGTTPAIAYPILENQLLQKQNMMSVDAVSGATYSLYRFRYALTIALIQAKIAKKL
jgi:major membrane immunogen (membrane-anchored lipoprotein)